MLGGALLDACICEDVGILEKFSAGGTIFLFKEWFRGLKGIPFSGEEIVMAGGLLFCSSSLCESFDISSFWSFSMSFDFLIFKIIFSLNLSSSRPGDTSNIPSCFSLQGLGSELTFGNRTVVVCSRCGPPSTCLFIVIPAVLGYVLKP